MSSFSDIGLNLLSARTLAFAPVSSFAWATTRKLVGDDRYVICGILLSDAACCLCPAPAGDIPPAAVVEYRGNYPYARYREHRRYYENDHGWRRSHCQH